MSAAARDKSDALRPPPAPKGMLAHVLGKNTKVSVESSPAQERALVAPSAIKPLRERSGADARTELTLPREISVPRREGTVPSPSSIPPRSSKKTEVKRASVSDQAHDVIDAVTLPPDEFLEKFRQNASDCLHNIYVTNRSVQSSSSGVVSLGLAEDISFIVSAQIDILHDYLVSSHLLCSNAGDSLLAEAARTVVQTLRAQQIDCRDSLFTGDVERCCAISNDFYRLMDVPEDVLERFRERYPHMREDDTESSAEVAIPSNDLADLTALYGSDAVYAAHMIQGHAMQTFHDETDVDGCPTFFSREWEEDLTSNEVATNLVLILEHYLREAEACLMNKLLYKKAVDAMVAATVALYIRMMLCRAEDVRHARRKWKRSVSLEQVEEPTAFTHASRAMIRIDGDIETFRSFFDNLGSEMPALKGTVEKKFVALTAIQECLCIALESPGVPDSLLEFVVMLHKLTGCKYGCTKLLVCDLWQLMTPEVHQAAVLSAVESLEDDLNKLNNNIADVGDQRTQEELTECARIPSLSLGLMLADFYGDDARRKVNNKKYRHRTFLPSATKSFLRSLSYKQRQVTSEEKKSYQHCRNQMMSVRDRSLQVEVAARPTETRLTKIRLTDQHSRPTQSHRIPMP